MLSSTPHRSSGAPGSAADRVTPVILAGGLGTRLRGCVPELPKVLAPVLGRPFISVLLDQLSQAEFGEVILSTGYKGEIVQAQLGDCYGPMAVTYSRETTPRGTGGGVRLAVSLVKTDLIMVMNGDSFVDVDLGAYVERHLAQGYRSSLVLVRVPDTGRFGRVDLDDGGHVCAFREKADASGAGWINAGVYLFPTEIIRSLPPDTSLSLERDLLPTLTGSELHGYTVEGDFIDIGTPESLSAAETFFSGREKKDDV